MYKLTYETSRAVVIGINKYSHTSPLDYAVQDAKGVADTLVSDLSFSKDHVHMLLDEDATRSSILSSYMTLCRSGTEENDRLIVFFAGHGHTERSLRGEVGYLVPSDGNVQDLATLLRWDDLTRSADLIHAKHILFLMDACYGGLAITRSAGLGSMRFMRDMMRRMSRQVLTAGKANEEVADSGGPLPDHSVFTGHLINGLKGAAADSQGVLTASGLTAYVYQCVRSDDASNQTPHYGHLYGDGDMILLPFQTQPSDAEISEGADILYAIPTIIDTSASQPMTEIDKLKVFLSESKYKINLFDQISQQTRETLSATSDDYFQPQGIVDTNNFLERLARYENAVSQLMKSEMLIGFWGTREHVDSLTLPIKRLAERITLASGNSFLLSFRWYPISLLFFSAGLGALSSGNYNALLTLMMIPVPEQHSQTVRPLVKSLTASMGQTYEVFSTIEGHQRQYVASSEYMFKFFQPMCDDLLFAGTEYEALFDRFELFYALQYAHSENSETISASAEIWGPIGRFGWKGKHYGKSALSQLFLEAQKEGPRWPPLQAGFFGGSLSRFQELASGLQRWVDKLPWF